MTSGVHIDVSLVFFVLTHIKICEFVTRIFLQNWKSFFYGPFWCLIFPVFAFLLTFLTFFLCHRTAKKSLIPPLSLSRIHPYLPTGQKLAHFVYLLKNETSPSILSTVFFYWSMSVSGQVDILVGCDNSLWANSVKSIAWFLYTVHWSIFWPQILFFPTPTVVREPRILFSSPISDECKLAVGAKRRKFWVLTV